MNEIDSLHSVAFARPALAQEGKNEIDSLLSVSFTRPALAQALCPLVALLGL